MSQAEAKAKGLPPWDPVGKKWNYHPCYPCETRGWDGAIPVCNEHPLWRPPCHKKAELYETVRRGD